MKERITNIDLLKCICIFSVILLHVSSHQALDITYNYIYYNNFYVLNFFNMITRFCVPGFIMISGMFLLDKDISIKTILKKYILRIFILYIIFSFLYSIDFHHTYPSVKFIDMFSLGYYHLWYLFVIMGLYIVTPFLRLIVKDKKLTIYFLILCFIFAGFIPFVTELFNIHLFDSAIKNLNIHIPMGYVGYYVAGYYFSKNSVNKYIFYILGIIGFILNYIIFNIVKYPLDLYEMVFRMPTTFLYSIAIFIFFKNLKVKKSKIISHLASLTTGIYLVHLFILKIIFSLDPYYIYNNVFLNPLMIAIIIYIISMSITIILKKIPLFKKII